MFLIVLENLLIFEMLKNQTKLDRWFLTSYKRKG